MLSTSVAGLTSIGASGFSRRTKEQGLYRSQGSPDPIFSDTLELDLATVEPSLAGPKRPHDRVALAQMKEAFHKALTAPVQERGFGLGAEEVGRTAAVELRQEKAELRHGSVVIAAITSCTTPVEINYYRNGGILQTVLRKLLGS